MIWILGPTCLILSLLALLATYEAFVGIGYHTDDKAVRPVPITCPLTPPPRLAATRGVLFVVDGLRVDSGLSYPVNSTSGRVKLKFSQTRSTFIALATGRHDSPMAQLSGRPSQSDSIFRYPKKTLYAGPYGPPFYFSEGNWLADPEAVKVSELQNRKLTNISHFDRTSACQIKNTITGTLDGRSRRELFVVHLVQIQLAAKFAGIHSAMYRNAVRETGEIIADLTRFFQDFYEDNSTFFMILSSHGTDERGKFGGGSPEELVVPLATWGKGSNEGVKFPVDDVDLCPLVAGSLGYPIPSDSRGNLPSDYMQKCLKYEAEAAVTVQTGELCLRLARKAGPIFRRLIKPGVTECQLKAFKREFGLFVKFPSNLHAKAKQCVEEYDNAYRTFIVFAVAAIYVALIVLLAAYLTPKTHTVRFPMSGMLQIIGCVVIVIKAAFLVALVCVEGWPWYAAFILIAPALLWGAVMRTAERVLAAVERLSNKDISVYIVGTFLIVEIAYWCEYFVFAAPIFMIPYCTWTTLMNYKYVPKHVVYTWISSTIVLIVLPAVMAAISDPTTGSSALLNIGAATWIVGGALFAYRMDLKPKEQILAGILAAQATIAVWLVDLHALRFWNAWLAVISWLLVFTPLVMFFAADAISIRLMQFCMALSAPFMLLCYRQEPFILTILVVHLYSWLRLEASSPQYPLQGFIRAAALHFYLIYSLTAMSIPGLMTSYETIFIPLFSPRDSPWLIAGLNWYKVTLVTAIVVSFWTAASMYVGSRVRNAFVYLLLLTTVDAFRHFVSFALTNSPLPLLVPSHLRFFTLVPPLLVVPAVMSVTKYREAINSRPIV